MPKKIAKKAGSKVTKPTTAKAKPAKKAAKKPAKKPAKKAARPAKSKLSDEELQAVSAELNKSFPKPARDLRVELMIDELHVGYATPGAKKGTWNITPYGKVWID